LFGHRPSFRWFINLSTSFCPAFQHGIKKKNYSKLSIHGKDIWHEWIKDYNNDMTSPTEDQSALAQQAARLRAEVAKNDPSRLACLTGAACQHTGASIVLRLPLWSRPVHLPFPELVAVDDETDQPLALDLQVILLYFLHTCDDEPPAGRWVSFSELPGGKFYAPAYQGYSGTLLGSCFGNDIARFQQSASRLAGLPIDFAGSSFAFQALPGLDLLASCWPGDEEFTASYQILFDANACHRLPVDVCAILGGKLARRLIKG
jgi:hypothetical protein